MARLALPLHAPRRAVRRAACAAMLCFAFVGAASAQPAAARTAVPWAALTVQQQTALAPLKRDWNQIDSVRRQKWLDVASRFGALSEPERERVQDRMAEWSRLTPEQRSHARLNYQELRQVDAEERQSRWEAYRQLPAERRNELARQAAQSASSAPARTRDDAPKSALVSPPFATSVKPVAPTVVQGQRGATTSLISQPAAPPLHQQAGLPKLSAKPGFVDPNTLLPRRGVQGAAVAASRSDKDAAAR